MSRLWYEQAAACWDEALPIGNGRLGAMVFGSVGRKHLQLNEETVWYGGPRDRHNPDALKNLGKVRQLIYGGKIEEAEELMKYAFSGMPQSERPYQSLGDLWIEMQGEKGQAEDYRRELSLEEATATVSYRMGEKTYKEKYFVSAPAGILAGEISVCGGTVSLDIMLERERFYEKVEGVGEDTLLLKGCLGDEGLDFRVACRVRAEGGTVSRIGEHLLVRDAKKVFLYLSGGTPFWQIQQDKKDVPDEDIRLTVQERQEYVACLERELLERLDKAAAKDMEALWQEHVEDYRALYGRVELELPEDGELEALPTDRRLERVKKGNVDTGLVKTYFDMGRYLLISSSRPGTLPANLQGIWNGNMKPPWDSKYTININAEMNYWPAEVCNLGECHEPLFGLLKRMMKNGRLTAERMYGCRGFVAHHNTDIWADTVPQDIYIPATYWVMGGAWLCTHIRMHYDYNRDVRWLAELADVLEEAVLFFEDFLEEKDGEYLICPSVSPENTYIMEDGTSGRICVSSTMDNQLLRQLLQDYLYVMKELRENGVLEETSERKAVMDKAEEILGSLPGEQVGRHGQIMEWRRDYEEAEPGHRHISQLYGLHPGRQITTDGTPVLAEAARKTLERRLRYGGGHTGWSCAWLVNLYARLWDGEKAWEMVQKLLGNSTSLNLLDNHPMGRGSVFQIDGNFGACAGILEMLVQCDESRAALLPACPKVWGEGKVRGVKLQGNALLDMAWKDGRVTECRIKALSDWTRTLKWNGKEQEISLKAGEEVKKQRTLK